jgi:type VI secretion system protein ImpK
MMSKIKEDAPLSTFNPRRENLAFAFQEAFTATVRLRSGRQSVADASAFRTQIREALRRADQEARTHGYAAETVKLAIFAVVAFLDETILNLQSQVFAEWVRKPLQEELFGVHVAGEMFFENLNKLLTQNDSPELSDILEVYLLCLQLGYRGRYGVGTGGDFRGISEAVREKLRRSRAELKYLAPDWAPPVEPPTVRRDVWTRRLVLFAAGCLLLTIILFAGFKLALSSSASALEAASSDLRK